MLTAAAPARRSATTCAEPICRMCQLKSLRCMAVRLLSARRANRNVVMRTALAENVKDERAEVGAPCRGGRRFCGNPALHLVVALAMSPLCETIMSRRHLLE